MATPQIDPAALDAVKAAIPQEILDALLQRELGLLKEKARANREEKRRKQGKQPRTNQWAAIQKGTYKRQARPETSVDDRQYVAGALHHWRKVHGLSYKEAQARIGYSARSCSWNHWESGHVVPPYRTLLRIIAATGLGYWTDNEPTRGIDPALRLEAANAAWSQETRQRRARRKNKKATAE